MQNKTLICLAIAAVFAFVIYKMYKKEQFQLERARMTGNTAMASIAAAGDNMRRGDLSGIRTSGVLNTTGSMPRSSLAGGIRF
jgi:hypothetical protein